MKRSMSGKALVGLLAIVLVIGCAVGGITLITSFLV